MSKRQKLKDLIKELTEEVLGEMSMTGTGSSFNPGTGAQYATPKAFAKTLKPKKGSEPFTKPGKIKKRPYHTKLFDYLDQ